MKLGEVFKGSYLKAEDLQGRAVQVQIEKADLVDFDDGTKLVLHFRGRQKALVTNKTNAQRIQEVIGSDDTDNWIGKTITLAATKVEFSGKLVPAIRVVLPETKPPAQSEPDDVPF